MSKNINPALKNVSVALVNGVVISEFQVASGLEAVLEPYRDTKGKVRLSQPQQYAARKQVIDNLVMRELLYQEGVRRQITVSDKEISQALAINSGEFSSKDQFAALLAAKGLSPEEHREQLTKDIIVNKTASECVQGRRRQITTEDARKYYEEHLGEMRGPEVRRILHVHVDLDRYASDAEEKKARALLQEMSDAETFEKIVREGQGPDSPVRSQDLGFVRRGGGFHPMLDSIAFRMPAGQVSRMIRTDEGLHRLLVINILPEGSTWPFEFIREELQKKLYEMRSVSMVNDLVASLRAGADVRILDAVADSKLEQEKQ